MSDTFKILAELAADNSRLAKESILKREKDNVLLQRVLKAALDPTINYWVKKIPSYTTSERFYTLGQAIGMLKSLADREYTGNQGIAHLTHILSHVASDDAKVIEYIIDRDLRCGVQEATINKIWPGLIFTFDVMLCHKDTSGIKYPAIAQEKGDGARCHLYYDGKVVSAWSRNGKQFQLEGRFDELAKHIMLPGETWDGELLCYKGNKVLDRKTGNGILSKALKGTISDDEVQMVKFMTWDIVDFTGKIQYQDRLDALTKRMKSAKWFDSTQMIETIFLCPSEIVNNESEAQAFYIKMRADGKEGAIIKNFTGIWEPKRVKSAGKLKAVEDADLRIIGIEEGTGKNVGKLGAFVMQTQDGKLTVNVGTGFTDKEREEMFDQKYIGRVGTIAYNEKIQDKKLGEWSLFLPRWIELREDKDVANTFGELK